MTKIAGSRSASGSIIHRHGSADPDPDPDPHQNVMDPQQRLRAVKMLGIQILGSPCLTYQTMNGIFAGEQPGWAPAQSRHPLSLKKKQLTDRFITRQARVTDGLDLLSPNITTNSSVKKVPVWSPLFRSVHQKSRFILSGRLIITITNRHVYQLGNRWIGFSSLFAWLIEMRPPQAPVCFASPEARHPPERGTDLKNNLR